MTAARDASCGGYSCELREWLESGVEALPPPQRLVIELTYFLGHSCEEIAAITSCPVNTVKTRLFHARERLRERLAVALERAPIVV